MKKIVVVSSNNNPDYLFFLPYITKAWNKLGWKVACLITHDVNTNEIEFTSGDNYLIQLPDIKGLRLETVAQASRLYAANYLPKDALLMTSDIDLLPLSDYWHPDINDVTVYGHDLTWRSFYPMGYIAMSSENWIKYMNLTKNTHDDILRDANDTSIPHSPFSGEWEQWWNYDWSLITARLKPHEGIIKFIDRGQINIAGATLAKGRIDRYNWEATQNQPEPFIDAHCENNNVKHPVKLEPFLKVFNKFYS